jgi:hypothetical protein
MHYENNLLNIKELLAQLEKRLYKKNEKPI